MKVGARNRTELAAKLVEAETAAGMPEGETAAGGPARPRQSLEDHAVTLAVKGLDLQHVLGRYLRTGTLINYSIRGDARLGSTPRSATIQTDPKYLNT